MSWSKREKIFDEGEWMVHTTVRPRWASLLRRETMVKAVDESSPLVGSALAQHKREGGEDS